MVAYAGKRVIVVGVRVALMEYANLNGASDGVDVVIDIQIAAAISA